MKTVKLMLALMLALLMALTAAAEDATSGEAAPAEDPNPVIMTVGGEEVRIGDIANFASYLYNYGYIENPNDYAGALDSYLNETILPRLKVREIGAENILGEAYAEEVKTAADFYDNMIISYVESTPGEAAYEEELQSVIAMYEEAGYSREKYISDYINGTAFNKLIDVPELMTATEDEIMSEYDTFVAEDKANFEGNVALYEMVKQYYGYTPFYTPEGYRGVTHILLEVDSAFTDAYKNAATDEDKKAAEEAMIESIKETIDTIYARLEAGEAFEALIAEYNTDPGMTSAENLANGYPVHKESTGYVQTFTDGSFAPEMTEVGSVSNPVPSNYGVHIIYYLRDIPSGAVELTEDLRYMIEQNCIYNKLMAQFAEWLGEYETVYTDAYKMYIG